MKWPWARTENRESSYTELLVGLALSRANGSAGTAKIGASGALQACVGLLARSFAAARVEGPANLTAGVTPLVLSTIGRALMRAGEAVYVIDLDAGGTVRLQPASFWEIQGDIDESTWLYRVNLPGPSTTRTRRVPSDGLIHVRYETDPDRPWKGVGPIQSASLAGRLSAETQAALADGESGPRGNVLPLPIPGDDPSIELLRSDLKNLSGQLATVQSVQSLHAGAAGNAPKNDWQISRIGANPPAAEVELLTRSGVEVVNACGCSGLFDATAAAASREAFRRFLHTTCQPLGRIVSHELSVKLDADIALSFDSITSADIMSRSRAWRSMVGTEAAMTPEVAARLAGLEMSGE